MKSKILAIFLIFVFILTSGFGCKLTSKETKVAMQPITLKYWRVFEGQDSFSEIIAAYQALHPFISIDYRKLRYEEYEDILIDAFAEDRGPDMFTIHNTWVNKYKNKLMVMPASITMAYPITKGAIKKEVIPELRTVRSMSLNEVKNNFADTVFDDVVIGGDVYGLPLSIDTMALYYNRDLLNNSGIPSPPGYWNREFQQYVKRLTKLDVAGKIIQSGVALGGSDNIDRSVDILSLLIMQNGGQMSSNNRIVFDAVPAIYKEQEYNPGLEALRFYTDFSNPTKEVYSWNNDLNNSLELFISGNLAMMFGYSYHLPTIESRAPKLNFGIAPMPQIEGASRAMNFANYWVEVVSRKSSYTDEAWDFIQFATRAENVKSFLAKNRKPSALRQLAIDQIVDEDVGVFAEQVLTSKSWYRGKDVMAAENIINEMIDTVGESDAKLEDIIKLGARKVQQTIY